jgi:hypothetical protein
VSIERIFYCDGPECERHVRTARLRSVFITVTDSTGRLHFCTWDCVLRHAAEKPPTEVVSLGSDAL